jgi:hypothetical protein
MQNHNLCIEWPGTSKAARIAPDAAQTEAKIELLLKSGENSRLVGAQPWDFITLVICLNGAFIVKSQMTFSPLHSVLESHVVPETLLLTTSD